MSDLNERPDATAIGAEWVGHADVDEATWAAYERLQPGEALPLTMTRPDGTTEPISLKPLMFMFRDGPGTCLDFNDAEMIATLRQIGVPPDVVSRCVSHELAVIIGTGSPYRDPTPREFERAVRRAVAYLKPLGATYARVLQAVALQIAQDEWDETAALVQAVADDVAANMAKRRKDAPSA